MMALIRYISDYQNLMKNSSNIYFTVATWYAENVGVKPHFNTQCPPTPLNNFKIIGKTTCHANNNFPTLLEGLPVKKSFGSYLGFKTVINNFGVALHYTVWLQRGSCIYGFEGFFLSHLQNFRIWEGSHISIIYH